MVLKVLKPLGDPQHKFEEWTNEYRMYSGLRHPNIVSIHDAFVYNGLFYIVLERAWGSIESWLPAIGRLDNITVRSMAKQLLFGLHHIHKHRVIHRDINIKNCLVFFGPENKGATFKITDFGLSKGDFSAWTPPVAFSNVGTLLYVAPELLAPGGHQTRLSDLYHLGLLLYYAHVGRLPYPEIRDEQSFRMAVINGTPFQYALGVGAPFGELLASMLHPTPNARIQSALAAWNLLQ